MNAGSELDSLVAEKVMGKEVMPATSYRKWGVRAPTASHWIGQWAPLPTYSTDIAAAQEVEQTILARDDDIRHAYIISLCEQIGIPLGWDSNTEQMWKLLQATPQQRCLAALKSVGQLCK